LHPEYGYEKKNKKLISKREIIKTRNITLISAIDNTNVCFSQLFNYSPRSSDFFNYILGMIENLKLDQENFVIVMDNCATHKSRFYKKLKDFIPMIFLPKYSPFLNPIETYFGYLKREMKKENFRDEEELLKKLKQKILNTPNDVIDYCNRSSSKYIIKILNNDNSI
jgi:transposase